MPVLLNDNSFDTFPALT